MHDFRGHEFTLFPCINENKDVVSSDTTHQEDGDDLKVTEIAYSENPRYNEGSKGETQENDGHSYN